MIIKCLNLLKPLLKSCNLWFHGKHYIKTVNSVTEVTAMAQKHYTKITVSVKIVTAAAILLLHLRGTYIHSYTETH